MKISETKLKIACGAIARGVPINKAGQLAGICRLSRWMQNHEKIDERVRGAEAQFADECLATVKTAAVQDKDWKAAAWLLSRRFPREFAEIKRTEAPDDGGNTPQENAKNILARLAQSLEKPPE